MSFSCHRCHIRSFCASTLWRSCTIFPSHSCLQTLSVVRGPRNKLLLHAVGLSFELSSSSWSSVSKRSLFLVLLKRLFCFLLSCFSKAAWQMSVYYSPISRVISHQSCVVLFFFWASGYLMGWSPLQVLCSVSFLQDKIASCASVEASNDHDSPSLHIEVPPLLHITKKHKAGSAAQTLGQRVVESVGCTSLPRCLVSGSSISQAAVGRREYHALYLQKGAKAVNPCLYQGSIALASLRAINGPI